MSKLYVTMKVEGRFIVEVDTNDVQKAKELASEIYSDANFGELSDIDAETINVQDENGNFLFEK